MPVVNNNGIKYLQFGYGDLYVGTIDHADTGEPIGIAIVSDSPSEIGSERPEHIGKTVEQVQTEIVMQFDSFKSLDVVIEVLQTLRAKMEDDYIKRHTV